MSGQYEGLEGIANFREEIYGKEANRRINLDGPGGQIWPNLWPGTGPGIIGPTITPNTQPVYEPLDWTKGIKIMTEVYNYQIRRVENGFVMKIDTKEFVFETVDSLLNKLREQLEPKKENKDV